MLNEHNLVGMTDGIEKSAFLPLAGRLAMTAPKLIGSLLGGRGGTALAGRHLKRITGEYMGGKNPIKKAVGGLKTGLVGTALTIPVVGAVGLHQMTAGMPKAKPLPDSEMQGY